MAIIDDSGETIEAGDSYEVNTIKPLIADGTWLNAQVVSVDIKDGGEYADTMVIGLQITTKGEYAGREEKHNLKVFDADAGTRKKALEMLVTYDNLGKRLIQRNKKNWNELSATELYDALVGTRVAAKFAVWEMEGRDGQMRSGNWVQAIKPAELATAPSPAPTPRTAPKPAPVVAPADDSADFDEDSIPF